ncbi:MAG: cupin domain-containing protein, partial [Planctomycetes bacterium]|nr:cupin domain-containing protein [Planctomycetota bacterium]
MAGYAAHNGGRFVAGRGGGRHPTRVIDSWEMIFVERGRLAMTVGGAGHDLGPGEGLFIAPGVRHGGARDY